MSSPASITERITSILVNDTFVTSFSVQQHTALVVINVLQLLIALLLLIVLLTLYIRSIVKHIMASSSFSSTLDELDMTSSSSSETYLSLLLRVRGSTASPLFFSLFVLAVSCREIFFHIGSIVHQQDGNLQTVGVLWSISAIIHALVSFPALFLAMMSQLLQSLQYGVYKDILEYMKRSIVLRQQQQQPTAAAVELSTQSNEPGAGGGSHISPTPSPRRISARTAALMRFLKIISSTRLQVLVLVVLVVMYEVLCIIMAVLQGLGVVSYVMLQRVTSSIVTSVIILLVSVVSIVSLVEVAIGIVQYIRSRQREAAAAEADSSEANAATSETTTSSYAGHISLPRYVLNFLLDKPSYCRLERLLLIPSGVLMAVAIVNLACNGECYPAQAQQALILTAKFMLLFSPGGMLVLLIALGKTIQSKFAAAAEGKAYSPAVASNEGSSGQEVTPSKPTKSSTSKLPFGELMVKMLTSEKRSMMAKRRRFEEFCAREWSSENVHCAIDLLRMKQIPMTSPEWVAQWRSILEHYVQKNAPLECNIAGPVRTACLSTMTSLPDLKCIEQAHSQLLRAIMVNLFDTWQRFKAS